ncbi:hypothetical protein KFZ56_18930 [Virgibacillus sp. NKC19-3]|nr:hypothetical protein [Virgibacillus sp. NKC19-3]
MLWIATQDNKSLMNVKEITVNRKKVEGVIGSGAMAHWGKTLGTYETKERASEILNDIFEKMAESSSISVTYMMPKK